MLRIYNVLIGDNHKPRNLLPLENGSTTL
jgi:hypothetical protein